MPSNIENHTHRFGRVWARRLKGDLCFSTNPQQSQQHFNQVRLFKVERPHDPRACNPAQVLVASTAVKLRWGPCLRRGRAGIAVRRNKTNNKQNNGSGHACRARRSHSSAWATRKCSTISKSKSTLPSPPPPFYAVCACVCNSLRFTSLRNGLAAIHGDTGCLEQHHQAHRLKFLQSAPAQYCAKNLLTNQINNR